jgi:hypothetical protein
MADYIRPTPRNPILGLLADALTGGVQYMRDPRRAQQMQGLGGLLAETGIPATMERLSYGEPLTTGRGMTTRLRPEAEAALMTLGPEAVPIGRGAMAGVKAAERGAMAAGRAGERYAERVVPQVMERGGLPAQMLEGMASQTVSPLTVYHGSPYRFNRFDPTKIGSGEGAQAYGHGLYFAESPDVAKGYRNKLNDPIIDSVKADLYEIAGDPQWSVQAFDASGKLIPKAKGYLAPDEIAKHYGEDVANLVLSSKYGGHFKNLGIQEGALYKVDLPDEKIARMLDWDKPLSEQSDYIKRIIKENELDYVPEKSTGGRLLEEMNKAFDPEIVSKHLRQAGIPGIRYLDQGSRGAGQGTSNFVVFPGEEDLLRILSVNGGLLAP